ncbi:sensor domain-containing diguanylate cyclase [Paenibacillus chitinolyticus]|uniref:sensor domain-containing diguanylate cyclase n=1 Tax=Paenibacillus chitinolyticus TaxID=79263 RepID=UPI001C44BD7E|nr:diguanylate cyclase [Paenibacillus chitinolyticus]MBV6717256.1 diguanylate cyclase [Paenibacillus chitinolyticus]
MNMTVISGLISTTILAMMSLVGFLLFRRWRSRSYFALLICIVTGTIIQLIQFLDLSVYTGGFGAFLMTSLFSFIALQIGIVHLFNPKDAKTGKALLFIGMGSVIIGLSSTLTTIVISSLAALIMSIGFCAYMFLSVLPRLQKKKMHMTVWALHISSSLSAFLAITLDTQFLMHLALFIAALTYAVIFTLFFERILDLMQAVSYSSTTDGFTGLLNKHYFIKKVNHAIKDAEPCAIIFSDIDNFKRLNDTEGHQTGDTMLKFAAKTLKDVCEGVGICGRYGGEEMVALITDLNSDPAVIAEKYRSAIEERSKEVGLVPMTVSVGYSRLKSGVTDAEEFIKQADTAMYRSKAQGKNQVTEYGVEIYNSKPEIVEIIESISEDPIVVPQVESLMDDRKELSIFRSAPDIEEQPPAEDAKIATEQEYDVTIEENPHLLEETRSQNENDQIEKPSDPRDQSIDETHNPDLKPVESAEEPEPAPIQYRTRTPRQANETPGKKPVIRKNPFSR